MKKMTREEYFFSTLAKMAEHGKLSVYQEDSESIVEFYGLLLSEVNVSQLSLLFEMVYELGKVQGYSQMKRTLEAQIYESYRQVDSFGEILRMVNRG